MKLSDLLRYFFIPVYKPKLTTRAMLLDKSKVAYSIIVIFFLRTIYTITAIVGHTKGYSAYEEPLLDYLPAITGKHFVKSPLFLLIAVIFAGICRLMSLAFRGKGNFEDAFAICCIALTLPTFIMMWLPESLFIFFFSDKRVTISGGFTLLPLWLDYLRQGIGIAWPLIIITMGMSMAEEIKWYWALMATVVAAIPFTALLMAFVG